MFRPRVGCVLVLGLTSLQVHACRSEGTPPPPLHALAEDSDSDGEQAESGSDDHSRRLQPKRELWFDDGPGRAAILARERRDHALAVRELDAVLTANHGVSSEDRAGAAYLRALEHQDAEEYVQAAELFARARKSKALAPVRGRLRLLEAQARLDAGQPEVAVALVDDVPERAPLMGDLLIVRADALARVDREAEAIAIYRDYVERLPRGARIHEARAKLARVLMAQPRAQARQQAVKLWEQLLLEAPLSDYGEEAAKRLEHESLARWTKRTGKAARDFERRLALSRLEAQLDRGQYQAVEKQSKRFLSRRKLTNEQRCRALYLRGTAIFKQRRRADALPSFRKGGWVCAQAGDEARLLEVKSRYQAARGHYARGNYRKAAKAFLRLAKDHADHSYADDALVLAGESWEEAGEPSKARAAYRKALGDVRGDMALEAVRRLFVSFWLEDEDRQALELLDETLDHGVSDLEQRSKLHYFRGRVLARQGHDEQAGKAWLAAVSTRPLGYPALQALSRLRELDGELHARALQILTSTEVPPDAIEPLSPPGDPAATRARILARLGLGRPAKQELDAAGIRGWPAVALLHQAGLYAEVQRMIARFADDWRRWPPNDGVREHWKIAHPRPFRALVMAHERKHDVPDSLAYAIMQTESRFDPGVTSWAGARGLIQLMPGTAKHAAQEAGVALNDPEVLYDPAINVDVGLYHLGKLVAQFGDGPEAVALAIPGYNAGSGAVHRWLGERGGWDLDLFLETIPYRETRRYTQSVLGRWMTYRWLYGDGAAQRRVPYLSLQLESGN